MVLLSTTLPPPNEANLFVTKKSGFHERIMYLCTCKTNQIEKKKEAVKVIMLY